MKVIKVKIKGAGMGLLLHNPAGMGAGNGGKKFIPSPEQEAKAAAYYMEDGVTLAIPGTDTRPPCEALHHPPRDVGSADHVPRLAQARERFTGLQNW
jgi:hypothetical protein